MTAAAFDTLKLARTLRDKAKLSPEQAEGFTDAMAEILQGDTATKGDMQEVRGEIRGIKGEVQEARGEVQEVRGEVQAVKADVQAVKADLRETELRLRAEIEGSKAEIIKWMFGTVGFQSLLILGAVVALARLIKP